MDDISDDILDDNGLPMDYQWITQLKHTGTHPPTPTHPSGPLTKSMAQPAVQAVLIVTEYH